MIAGYILTGGKNRRMNGEKKLFLEYKGKTFFDHIKNSLQLFSNIYLSVDAFIFVLFQTSRYLFKSNPICQTIFLDNTFDR